MKKNKFIISIHSFIDIITNSSTELFVVDEEKTLELVRNVVNQALIDFPSSYGIDCCSVNLEDATYYLDYVIDNSEDAITYLKDRGYKIEAPEKEKEPQSIVISWERGTMSNEFITFIGDTFGTELIDY